MALVEYFCKQHGKYEILEPREKPLCPKCKKKGKKVISLSHLKFIGSGFQTKSYQ